MTCTSLPGIVAEPAPEAVSAAAFHLDPRLQRAVVDPHVVELLLVGVHAAEEHPHSELRVVAQSPIPSRRRRLRALHLLVLVRTGIVEPGGVDPLPHSAGHPAAEEKVPAVGTGRGKEPARHPVPIDERGRFQIPTLPAGEVEPAHPSVKGFHFDYASGAGIVPYDRDALLRLQELFPFPRRRAEAPQRVRPGDEISVGRGIVGDAGPAAARPLEGTLQLRRRRQDVRPRVRADVVGHHAAGAASAVLEKRRHHAQLPGGVVQENQIVPAGAPQALEHTRPPLRVPLLPGGGVAARARRRRRGLRRDGGGPRRGGTCCGSFGNQLERPRLERLHVLEQHPSVTVLVVHEGAGPGILVRSVCARGLHPVLPHRIVDPRIGQILQPGRLGSGLSSSAAVKHPHAEPRVIHDGSVRAGKRTLRGGDGGPFVARRVPHPRFVLHRELPHSAEYQEASLLVGRPQPAG